MKIILKSGHYFTDEGTNGRRRVLLDYLWCGSEKETLGYLDGKKLIKLKNMLERIIKRRKKNKPS